MIQGKCRLYAFNPRIVTRYFVVPHQVQRMSARTPSHAAQPMVRYPKSSSQVQKVQRDGASAHWHMPLNQLNSTNHSHSRFARGLLDAWGTFWPIFYFSKGRGVDRHCCVVWLLASAYPIAQLLLQIGSVPVTLKALLLVHRWPRH